MDSFCFEPIFDGTFRVVKLNFGGSEKFKQDGLSLVHNGC